MTFQDYKKAKQIMDKKDRLLRLIKFFEQGVEVKAKFYNGNIGTIYTSADECGRNKKYPYPVDINCEELNIIRESLFHAMAQCDTELSKI